MARAPVKLSFFLDNNVPDSIGRFLQSRGHSVYRQRHHIPPTSPDPVVATTAMEGGRILVSIDKDFNSQRFAQPRFARLSRIALSGPPETLLPAIRRHAHLVEYQWQHNQRAGARLIARVKFDQVSFRD